MADPSPKKCFIATSRGRRYLQVLPFYPHEHLNGKTEGGDLVNPGAGWYYEWEAPGPVYDVTWRHDGSHMEIFECNSDVQHEKVAHCHGWKNGVNFVAYMTVQWKMPCEPGLQPSQN